MFHRTISVVASALMMSGAAVALSPAAQAAPETYTGYLQLVTGDTVTGCARVEGDFSRSTTDTDTATRVSIQTGSLQDLDIQDGSNKALISNTELAGYPLNRDGNPGYAFVGRGDRRPAGTTGDQQSAIWSIDPSTKVLTPTFTWPDGSTEVLTTYEFAGENGLALTNDLGRVRAIFGFATARTFRLGSTCSGRADTAQAISFTSSAPATAYPGQTYTVTATGGASGNPVTFTSASSEHCTVDGSTVTFGTPGICTIRANQAAAPGYSAAPAATQDITVSAIPSTVSLSLDVDAVHEGQTAIATAQVGVEAGALTAAGGTVQFAVEGTDVGDAVAIDADGRATSPELTGEVGANDVTATYVPADSTNYAGSSASATLTVSAKALQEITFTSTAPTDPKPRDTYTVTATGGASGNPVTFSSVTEDQCTVTGSTVTFHRTGTCTITAEQAGNAGHVAATPVQQDITVGLIATSIEMTITPDTIVYGQDATATVQVSTEGGSVAEAGGRIGFVSFSSPRMEYVPIDAQGRATLKLDELWPGNQTLRAEWQPAADDVYATSSAVGSVMVEKVRTTTTLTVKAKELVATVSPVAPGFYTPTGEVAFFVDGEPVGTARTDDDGVATLAHAAPAGHAVSAQFLGNRSFEPSVASSARHNPVVTARVTSNQKARNGWYRTPVTISFACDTKGAELVEACPKPVTVTKQGASTVTRTIHTTDGGIATVSASVNLDRTAPKVSVKGVKAGRSYFDAPKATCSAKDSLSGVTSCKVNTKRKGSKVTVTAKATDAAGNVTTKRVSYRTATFTIRGAKKVGGVYRVKHGTTYTLVVKGAKPRYVYATPAPGKPHRGSVPFKKAGKNTWALGVKMSMTTRGTRSWNLGYTQNGKLHVVKVKVTG